MDQTWNVFFRIPLDPVMSRALITPRCCMWSRCIEKDKHVIVYLGFFGLTVIGPGSRMRLKLRYGSTQYLSSMQHMSWFQEEEVASRNVNGAPQSIPCRGMRRLRGQIVWQKLVNSTSIFEVDSKVMCELQPNYLYMQASHKEGKLMLRRHESL